MKTGKLYSRMGSTLYSKQYQEWRAAVKKGDNREAAVQAEAHSKVYAPRFSFPPSVTSDTRERKFSRALPPFVKPQFDEHEAELDLLDGQERGSKPRAPQFGRRR